MSNLCCTNITFKGNKADIEDLYEKLNSIFKKNQEFNYCWLGHVVSAFGLNPNKIKCRGEIVHIAEEVNPWGDLFHFEIITETAWMPMTEMWDSIIRKNYSSITYVFLAEDSDEEIHINTDLERDFYRIEYMIKTNMLNDCEEEEEIYCNSSKDVLDYMSQITNMRFSSIKEGKNLIAELLKKEDNQKVFSLYQYTSDLK